MSNTTAHTTTTGAAAVELVIIDPAALVIGDNARSDTDRALTTTFLASIREHGVLEPITAIRDGEGRLVVRDGQCRTLAAREAGLREVPVIVTPAAEGDEKAQTIDRISKQWAHNEHRTGLSAREKAATIHQLRLAGVSPTRIAREHLHLDKRLVDAALTAAKSSAAMDAMAAQDSLTLDQAATLAGYDGDDTAITKLLDAARDGRFEHAAAELAAVAEARAARATLRTQLETQGITVHDSTPSFADDVNFAPLGYLYTADGEFVGRTDDDQVPELVPAASLHAVIDTDEHEVWSDASGTPVGEDSIDWDLDDDTDPDTAPEGDLIDPRTLTRSVRAVAIVHRWYVIDPNTHGLFTWAQINQRRTAETGHTDTGDATASAGAESAESAADRAARVAQDQADREAAEKEQRRRVLKLNKLGVAAQQVRRGKLREVLGRKTLPKGTAAAVAGFVATTLWNYHPLLAQTAKDADAQQVTTELLGADPMTALDGAGAERRQVITLAIVCGAHEANLPKDAWRPAGAFEYSRMGRTARTDYLRFLADVVGYSLSDIEQVIVGDLDAATISLEG
ncbi:ParB/RepB/Spo0J family partition protein [Gordonia rhizosphera]|uniref:Putative chromosome partitioning protein ParB n=1 Tax=Gordonia rhizosphera NBRC 16068 TaxID=1108045 RepID=K6VQ71_9ACTN|nr:ParB N-terminal domain-containing protein [Gordonia rhizosphera]GAB89070.1 putative chromosome partitioning protein ParB [Gordonia rhizosphera NBRC 16068]